MKATLFFAFLICSVCAFGQQTEIIPQFTIDNVPVNLVCTRVITVADPTSFDDYIRLQIIKNDHLSVGAMPLSKDLPMVHTLHGTVYTFDHIRTQPRN